MHHNTQKINEQLGETMIDFIGHKFQRFRNSPKEIKIFRERESEFRNKIPGGPSIKSNLGFHVSLPPSKYMGQDSWKEGVIDSVSGRCIEEPTGNRPIFDITLTAWMHPVVFHSFLTPCLRDWFNPGNRPNAICVLGDCHFRAAKLITKTGASQLNNIILSRLAMEQITKAY